MYLPADDRSFPFLGECRYLQEGSILYVSVGPDGASGCDAQTLQFSLVKRSLLGLIQQNTGMLLNAINSGETANATVMAVYPGNWDRFSYYFATDISSTASYTAMLYGGSSRYTCGGGAIPNTLPGCNTSMNYAFVSRGGGVHPGRSGTYVIAGYNVTTPGYYSIVNSARRGTGACSDG
jgi:hypothetical protein